MFEIKRIMRKQINTKNGEKTQVRVMTEKDQWASCFEVEGVTDGWKIGDVVDADIVESNGFFNIVIKKDQKPAQKNTQDKPINPQGMITFEMIWDKLCEIEKKLNKDEIPF